MVVEKIASLKAVAVISWGPYKDTKAGWKRTEGYLDKGKPVFEWTAGTSRYRLSLNTRNGKTVFVDYIENGNFRRGWLSKIVPSGVPLS